MCVPLPTSAAFCNLLDELPVCVCVCTLTPLDCFLNWLDERLCVCVCVRVPHSAG